MCSDLAKQKCRQSAPISLNKMQTKSSSISLTDPLSKCAPISLNKCAAEVGFDHFRWVSFSGPGLPPAKPVNTAGQLVSVLRRFGLQPVRPRSVVISSPRMTTCCQCLPKPQTNETVAAQPLKVYAAHASRGVCWHLSRRVCLQLI